MRCFCNKWLILLVFASLTPVIGRKLLSFQPTQEDYSVTEGSSVRIMCQHETTGDIEIRSFNKTIVVHSTLKRGYALKYEFHVLNDTTCYFVIRITSPKDDGTYTCKEGGSIKFATLHVHHDTLKTKLVSPLLTPPSAIDVAKEVKIIPTNETINGRAESRIANIYLIGLILILIIAAPNLL